jgi:hypothetical protein
MKKKCVIFNYIPNKTPVMKKKDDNFDEWYDTYQYELIEMYNNTINTMKNKNIIDKDHNFEKNFNLFINILYDSSSKYIKED